MRVRRSGEDADAAGPARASWGVLTMIAPSPSTPLRWWAKASIGSMKRGSETRTGLEGAYGALWVEPEDDARESQVIGLDTDGRRILGFGRGLVGGDFGRELPGGGSTAGIGPEMEGCGRCWGWRDEWSMEGVRKDERKRCRGRGRKQREE